MMCLLLPNSENRLKRILVQEKINIFDLYSDNQEYNKKIDEYFKRKYEKIQEKYEEISINNELIKEQIEGIEL
jgi:cell division protein ZapA (FtsZ GTPase activity inhibitor)